MNGTRGIIFGIGMALAVLVVFAASATAQNNTVYFDPDPSCAAPGETIVVTMYVNNSDPIQNWQADIYFDPTVVNITGYTCGEFPLGCQMAHHGNWVRRGGITGDGANLPPGIHELGTLTLKAIGPGTSTLDLRNHVMGNMYGQPLPNQVWIDGTFNTAAFYDNFTAPDGLNVNEGKWRGNVNIPPENPNHRWSARIENNTLTIGDGTADEMSFYVQSNPTFKNGTDNPLIFKADVRTSGRDGFYYNRFGFLSYDTARMWIIFEESSQAPGYLRTAYKIPGGPSYEGPLLSIDPHVWHNYQITWTGSHIYWYIDGEIVDEAEVSWNGTLCVGIEEDSNQIWVDNVSVCGGEIFDASPPGCSIVINGGAENSSCRIVTLNLSAEDPESGVVAMQFANDHTWDECWSDWEPYNTTKTWMLSDCPGEKKVYVKFKNGAGLESLAYFDTINLTLTCGDQNCDTNVNMMDIGAVVTHIFYGDPLCTPWAADVNCDDDINMMDVGLLCANVFYGEPLNCCKGC